MKAKLIDWNRNSFGFKFVSEDGKKHIIRVSTKYRAEEIMRERGYDL